MAETGKIIALAKAMGITPSQVRQEIAQLLPDEVDDWLESHITNPDSPPLDRSLTSSVSATPADITGDLKSASDYAIDAIYGPMYRCTLSNGTLANSGNGNAVNINEYIPCQKGDSVRFLPIRAVTQGYYYQYAYRIYDGSENVLVDVTTAAATNETVNIETDDAAYIRFALVEYNGSAYNPLRANTYGHTPAVNVILSASLSERVEALEDTAPLDYYKKISFANGSYKNIGNYDSGINTGGTRIYGQYVLSSPAYNITINPTNASYNYEYALFDEENTVIIKSTSWVADKKEIFSKTKIKTVRIDIRKSNNANIAPNADTGIVISINGSVNLEQVNVALASTRNDISNIPVRIRAMSHNVGKYNYGTGSGYAGDDVDEKLLAWKNMIGSNVPDFVMIQENVLYFDAGQTYSASNSLWAPLFPYVASDSGSLGISIRSKYPLKNAQKIAAGSRWVVVAETSIGAVNVAVAVTHLTPGYATADEETRQTEATAVISALSAYDHVILGGDFNTSDADTMALFTAAGYTLGNNGYFGAIKTLPNESVDNIMIKGFAFYNVTSSADQAITSDHYPVVAEMLMLV